MKELYPFDLGVPWHGSIIERGLQFSSLQRWVLEFLGFPVPGKVNTHKCMHLPPRPHYTLNYYTFLKE
jgi:hypothetical protein